MRRRTADMSDGVEKRFGKEDVRIPVFHGAEYEIRPEISQVDKGPESRNFGYQPASE